jgi:hypothetical protein
MGLLGSVIGRVTGSGQGSSSSTSPLVQALAPSRRQSGAGHGGTAA